MSSIPPLLRYNNYGYSLAKLLRLVISLRMDNYKSSQSLPYSILSIGIIYVKIYITPKSLTYSCKNSWLPLCVGIIQYNLRYDFFDYCMVLLLIIQKVL
jgi:hypothetical protein